jgi:hypothetical protein
MKRRHSTMFLITALILIPVFFGLMPLNFMQKLASGVPLSPVKPILKCNPCPFHSLASHPEAVQIDLSSVPIDPRPTVTLIPSTTAGDITPFGILPDILPLRC